MSAKLVRLAFFFEGGLLVLALALDWLFRFSTFERIHLEWQTAIWGIIATFPLFLGMWWCARLPWEPIRRVVRELDEKLIPLFLHCSHLELAVISLLAGVGEEALFRGVLQGGLARWLHPWVALSVTSLLFGLGHLITPTYAILAGLIGLYLGSLVWATQDLLLVMIAHSVYDYVALVYLIHRQRVRIR